MNPESSPDCSACGAVAPDRPNARTDRFPWEMLRSRLADKLDMLGIAFERTGNGDAAGDADDDREPDDG